MKSSNKGEVDRYEYMHDGAMRSAGNAKREAHNFCALGDIVLVCRTEGNKGQSMAASSPPVIKFSPVEEWLVRYIFVLTCGL